jgi:hypothetical protein
VLAVTFLANIGGNLDAFDSVDRPASVAGLASFCVIPDVSAGICTNHAASTADSCEPATLQRSPA